MSSAYGYWLASCSMLNVRSAISDSTSCSSRMSGHRVPSRVNARAASWRWTGLKSSNEPGLYIGR